MLAEFFDWMISNLVFFWLVIAVLFLFMEMGSPGLFFFLSFFFGALVAAFSTFFTSSIIVQGFIFLGSSVIAFAVLRLWVKKKVLKAKEHELTNIYALKGKRAKVIKSIVSPESGKVKVYGEIWSARTLENGAIEQGVYVEIVDIRGSHLIVKKINK